ncbi:MAG: choline-sulfatase [Halieaceae bacterium]|nr:choline-sulfatase [Halieaceae bacterium]
MADQLSAKALGCYGNSEVISPTIDKLADRGVLFENAYTNSPLCTPARYALMTGQYISHCGGYDNAAYMPTTMPTFAHYLRLMGYKTYLSGKMHFVGPDQLHGFEERVTTDIYPADFGWIPDWTNADKRMDLWYHNMSSVKQAGVAAITNQFSYDDEVGHQAMRVIYDHVRSQDPRPMCLVTSFMHPHDPYATRQKYWDLYENVQISLPEVPRPESCNQDPHNLRLERAMALDAVDLSEAEIIRARRAYYGNVSYVDEWLGRLTATLDECGMADNTSIVFISDHGDMLGEYGLWYKMTFREWSCRIPMIVYDPRQFKSRRVKQAVSLVDVLPTLLDLAQRGGDTGKPAPIDVLDGRSLVPLCMGQDINDPDRTVSEYLGEGAAAPMLMIRRGRYKYIECRTDPDLLFDIESDPNEEINLAEDQAYEKVLTKFKSEAANHWDADQMRDTVIASQKRRRAVHQALQKGRVQQWDFNPQQDASEQYSRSHMDLTEFDINSRSPRPRPFNPRFK